METLLKISSVPQDVKQYTIEHLHYPDLDSQLVMQLTQQAQAANGMIFHQIAPLSLDLPGFELRHGAVSPAEIIIALGSAGVFTAVYEVIKSYLNRNQGRELTLSRGEVSITIKEFGKSQVGGKRQKRGVWGRIRGSVNRTGPLRFFKKWGQSTPRRAAIPTPRGWAAGSGLHGGHVTVASS
jgi:hypothetical protein